MTVNRSSSFTEISFSVPEVPNKAISTDQRIGDLNPSKIISSSSSITMGIPIDDGYQKALRAEKAERAWQEKQAQRTDWDRQVQLAQQELFLRQIRPSSNGLFPVSATVKRGQGVPGPAKKIDRKPMPNSKLLVLGQSGVWKKPSSPDQK